MELDDDVASLKITHRSATRTDDHGNAWVVVVEGDSAAPLQPQQRVAYVYTDWLAPRQAYGKHKRT